MLGARGMKPAAHCLRAEGQTMNVFLLSNGDIFSCVDGMVT